MQLKSEKPTDSIMLSFDAHWHKHFLQNPPSVVFRRRIPKTAVTKLYLYFNAPYGAIAGHADVVSSKIVSSNEAYAMLADSGLTSADLDKYVAGRASLGIFILADVVIFSKALNRQYLQDNYGLSPPQNFTYLNRSIIDLIERQFR